VGLRGAQSADAADAHAAARGRVLVLDIFRGPQERRVARGGRGSTRAKRPRGGDGGYGRAECPGADSAPGIAPGGLRPYPKPRPQQRAARILRTWAYPGSSCTGRSRSRCTLCRCRSDGASCGGASSARFRPRPTRPLAEGGSSSGAGGSLWGGWSLAPAGWGSHRGGLRASPKNSPTHHLS
jgi:hypothetical protein